MSDSIDMDYDNEHTEMISIQEKIPKSIKSRYIYFIFNSFQILRNLISSNKH
jgi:hypothetical protein